MGLVEHAKRELALIETDEKYINGIVKVVEAFAEWGHSSGSASIAIPTINDLLQFKNLSPLTNDPDEWQLIDPKMTVSHDPLWQSKRNAEAFSKDGGKSYHLLSEKESAIDVQHISKEKV